MEFYRQFASDFCDVIAFSYRVKTNKFTIMFTQLRNLKLQVVNNKDLFIDYKLENLVQTFTVLYLIYVFTQNTDNILLHFLEAYKIT